MKYVLFAICLLFSSVALATIIVMTFMVRLDDKFEKELEQKYLPDEGDENE